jgi:hypothetical protein
MCRGQEGLHENGSPSSPRHLPVALTAAHVPSFTTWFVVSRKSVSLGDILWKTTFWMDDLPLLEKWADLRMETFSERVRGGQMKKLCVCPRSPSKAHQQDARVCVRVALGGTCSAIHRVNAIANGGRFGVGRSGQEGWRSEESRISALLSRLQQNENNPITDKMEEKRSRGLENPIGDSVCVRKGDVLCVRDNVCDKSV